MYPLNPFDRLLRVEMHLDESEIPPCPDASPHSSCSVPTLVCDMPISLVVHVSMDDSDANDLLAVREFFPNAPPLPPQCNGSSRLEQLGKLLLASIALTPFGVKEVAGSPGAFLALGSPSFQRLSLERGIPIAASPLDLSTSQHVYQSPLAQKRGGSLAEADEEKPCWCGNGRQGDGCFMYGMPYFMEEPWDDRAISCSACAPRYPIGRASSISSTSVGEKQHGEINGSPRPLSPSSVLFSPATPGRPEEESSENRKSYRNEGSGNSPVMILDRTQIVHSVEMKCTSNEHVDVEKGGSAATFTATYHFTFRVPACLLESTNSMDGGIDNNRNEDRLTSHLSLMTDPKNSTEGHPDAPLGEGKASISPRSPSFRMYLVFVVQLLLWQSPAYLCARVYGSMEDHDRIPVPVPERVPPDSVLYLMHVLAHQQAMHASSSSMEEEGHPVGQEPHVEPSTSCRIMVPPSKRPHLTMLGCGGNITVEVCQPLRCRTVAHHLSPDHDYLLLSFEVVNMFHLTIYLYDAYFDWYTTRVLSSGELSSPRVPDAEEKDVSSVNGIPSMNARPTYGDEESGAPPSWRRHGASHQRMGPPLRDVETVYRLPQLFSVTPILPPPTVEEKGPVSFFSSPFCLSPEKSHVFSFRIQVLPQAQFSLQNDPRKTYVGGHGGERESLDASEQHPASSVSSVFFSSPLRHGRSVRKDGLPVEATKRVLSMKFSTSIFFDYELQSVTKTDKRLTWAHDMCWSFSGI